MAILDSPAEHEEDSAPSARILLIDNDAASNAVVSRALMKQNYSITTALDGEEALRQFAPSLYDLVILSSQLPNLSGYELCKELRKRSSVPIIFLGANPNTDSVIRALSYGADSYVIKPLTVQELRARIHALIRRTMLYRPPPRARQLRHDHILLDPDRQEVRVRNKLIHLTTTEFRLLKYFIENPDRPISMQELLSAVWEYDSVPDLNLIRVTISRLRSKIEESPSNPRYLKTIRKFGYRFLASKVESTDDRSESHQRSNATRPIPPRCTA